jgi:Glycosyl transferase family 11
MNIIVQLQGGLGNQLFQYATARSLSLEKNVPLLLDSTWYGHTYEDVTTRVLLLKQLKTAGSVVSMEPILRKPKRFRRFLQNICPISPFVLDEKIAYHFDSHILKVPAFIQQDLYLMGYWQSYKYFEAIKSVLASELTPLKPFLPHYLTYLDAIKKTQSAMVHIRRGDYVTLNSANRVHGIMRLEYYIHGMNNLMERNPETHFFVFSDDLSWAKQHLPNLGRLTFVESTDAENAVIYELELMKYCKSYLIANSSLSWWGAWLSYNKDAFVICPKHWTQDFSKDWGDLIPPNWVQL